MKKQLLLLVITYSALSANQIMMQPQEYSLSEEANCNVRSEDPLNDDVELLDFPVDTNVQLDPATLQPPFLVVHLLHAYNTVSSPVLALWKKICTWFRVHPSARGHKIR